MKQKDDHSPNKTTQQAASNLEAWKEAENHILRAQAKRQSPKCQV